MPISSVIRDRKLRLALVGCGRMTLDHAMARWVEMFSCFPLRVDGGSDLFVPGGRLSPVQSVWRSRGRC